MGSQVIIVDDDPIVGTLTLELLEDAGFQVRLIQDSTKAQAEIKKEKPALVVLDILMPGLDGLSLLHKLKTDPDTAKIRAIVVSGKSFEADKNRALQYGAEMFIEKPYEVESFARRITEMLKADGVSPSPHAKPAAPAPALRSELRVALWGCRSEGKPAAGPSRYGRRTSCVSVEMPRHMLIFDGGSGLATLGAEIVSAGKHKALWMFLTHFHWDHTEGLSSFPCAKDPSFTLHIAGASDPDKPFERALEEAFKTGPEGAMPAAKIELYEMREETYEILPGVRLTAFHANHPGTTLAYILLADDRKIVYCPDSELYGQNATALQDYDEKLGGLVRGADLLFHDGRFTEEDYKARRNTGHSSFASAVDFAARNKVKQLVLVHQDASYSDEVLDKMAADAEERAKQAGGGLNVVVGREGLRLSA